MPLMSESGFVEFRSHLLAQKAATQVIEVRRLMHKMTRPVHGVMRKIIGGAGFRQRPLMIRTDQVSYWTESRPHYMLDQ